MQKVVTNLWFDDQAEQAAKFYVSLIKNSKIARVSYYGEAGPGKKGTVVTVEFQLDGQHFVAINGGSFYRLTPAVSLMINCDTQHEIDELWEKLLADGGKEEACGWLRDKYGLSWQVVPKALADYPLDGGPKADAMMRAMFKMKKLDLKTLEDAYRRS